jgi:hypothetical protein
MNQPYSYAHIFSTGKNSAWARLELAFTGKKSFFHLEIFDEILLKFINIQHMF